MKYRYEYLSDDFDNVNNVFKNVKVQSLHKDVKLKDLIIDFEKKKVNEEEINEYEKSLSKSFSQRTDIVNNSSSNVQEVDSDDILTLKEKELIISQPGSDKLTEDQKQVILNQINTMDSLESYLAAIDKDDLYYNFLNLR